MLESFGKICGVISITNEPHYNQSIRDRINVASRTIKQTINESLLDHSSLLSIGLHSVESTPTLLKHTFGWYNMYNFDYVRPTFLANAVKTNTNRDSETEHEGESECERARSEQLHRKRNNEPKHTTTFNVIAIHIVIGLRMVMSWRPHYCVFNSCIGGWTKTNNGMVIRTRLVWSKATHAHTYTT